MATANSSKIIVLDPSSDAVIELLDTLKSKNDVEVFHTASIDEAVELIAQYSPCMVVSCIANNEAIPSTVTLIKKIESFIKYGLLKTLVVSRVKQQNLSNLITGLGITDYIIEPVPVRTLYFKSNLQLKALDTIKKNQNYKHLALQQTFKKKTEGSSDAVIPSGLNAPLAPALTIAEDMFLFKNGATSKNDKKLSIELEGPSPQSGEWIQNDDNGSKWRWIDADQKESNATKNGDGWVHEGEKPQYDFATNKWRFDGEKLELSFYKNKEKLGSKVKMTTAGQILIASDSDTAKENLENRAAKLRANERYEKKTIVLKKKQRTEEVEIDPPKAEPEAGGNAALDLLNKLKEKQEEQPEDNSQNSSEESSELKKLPFQIKKKRSQEEFLNEKIEEPVSWEDNSVGIAPQIFSGKKPTIASNLDNIITNIQNQTDSYQDELSSLFANEKVEEEKNKIKAQKKDILAKIQVELNATAPDSLTDAEIYKLKEQLGIPENSNISNKDLYKKSRIEKIRKLKEEISGLNNQLIEIESNPSQIPKIEVAEKNIPTTKNSSEKSNELDSDLYKQEAKESRPESENLVATKNSEIAAENSEKFYYLNNDESFPLEFTWKKTVPYFIYIASSIQDKGFQSLEELLPIYVYRGDSKPELIDDNTRWRFHSNLPKKVINKSELPKEVITYLAKYKNDQENAPAEIKKELSPNIDLELEEQNKKLENEKSTIELNALAREELNAPENPSGEESILPESIQDFNDETKSSANDSSKITSDASEKLKNESIEANESETSKTAEEITLEAEKESQQRSNASIDNFFNRRKNKNVELINKRKEQREKAKQEAKNTAAQQHPTNPYLAIDIAFSDALNHSNKEWIALAPKILSLIVHSIGSCNVFIFEPVANGDTYTVIASTINNGSRTITIDDAGIKYEIYSNQENGRKVWGHIYTQPLSEMRVFDDAERIALKHSADLFAALIESQNIEEKAA